MLMIGGCLSLAASVLHIACIIGGPTWYRFLGAGEEMARAAERGLWMPAIVTSGIAAVLAIWAAYAFSGAGVLPRLPLLRTGLVTVSAIYLLRAFAFIPFNMWAARYSNSFAIITSAIVLIFGIAYAAGTWRAWTYLAE